ncbi:unnamed protein product [Protopolystoma xenopodis]|uniref:SAM-dependent MTase TRM10-type domain-containing protein n=1 Tax=Protopolystoma xenopodis TaxID=117903 RepID=A0A3S5CSA1_9PLAT|nr:unnamed protein product [Protopolystoma xenopodis]
MRRQSCLQALVSDNLTQPDHPSASNPLHPSLFQRAGSVVSQAPVVSSFSSLSSSSSDMLSLPGSTRRREIRKSAVALKDSTCKTHVVIDCDYEHIMSPKEICKLAHQV